MSTIPIYNSQDIKPIYDPANIDWCNFIGLIWSYDSSLQPIGLIKNAGYTNSYYDKKTKKLSCFRIITGNDLYRLGDTIEIESNQIHYIYETSIKMYTYSKKNLIITNNHKMGTNSFEKKIAIMNVLISVIATSADAQLKNKAEDLLKDLIDNLRDEDLADIVSQPLKNSENDNKNNSSESRDKHEQASLKFQESIAEKKEKSESKKDTPVKNVIPESKKEKPSVDMVQTQEKLTTTEKPNSDTEKTASSIENSEEIIITDTDEAIAEAARMAESEKKNDSEVTITEDSLSNDAKSILENVEARSILISKIKAGDRDLKDNDRIKIKELVKGSKYFQETYQRPKEMKKALGRAISELVKFFLSVLKVGKLEEYVSSQPVENAKKEESVITNQELNVQQEVQDGQATTIQKENVGDATSTQKKDGSGDKGKTVTQNIPDKTKVITEEELNSGKLGEDVDTTTTTQDPKAASGGDTSTSAPKEETNGSVSISNKSSEQSITSLTDEELEAFSKMSVADLKNELVSDALPLKENNTLEANFPALLNKWDAILGAVGKANSAQCGQWAYRPNSDSFKSARRAFVNSTLKKIVGVDVSAW